MNRKNNYKDMDKFKTTKRNQQYRYHHKLGSGYYKPRRWDDWEDELVLKHEKPDRELSIELERSVKSISVHRAVLKKRYREDKKE